MFDNGNKYYIIKMSTATNGWLENHIKGFNAIVTLPSGDFAFLR